MWLKRLGLGQFHLSILNVMIKGRITRFGFQDLSNNLKDSSFEMLQKQTKLQSFS